MAKGLQTLGLRDLLAFKTRVNRQYTYRRISLESRDHLIEKINELEAYVISMDEKPDPGEEDGPPWL